MSARKALVALTILISVLTFNFALTQESNVEHEQELFETANNLYRKGLFEKSMQMYKQIKEKSAYTNYNLGNCAYNLEQYGWALLYWRRAERKWGIFNKSELLDNISLIKEKIQSMSDLASEKGPLNVFFKIKSMIISLVRSTPILPIQLVFLILWLFLFIFIRFLYKKKKKVAVSTLFALIAFFGIILVARYSIDSRMYAVVVSTQKANLLSGPGNTFQTIMQLNPAQEVIIKKDSKEYYKVKAVNRTGWISKRNVEKI